MGGLSLSHRKYIALHCSRTFDLEHHDQILWELLPAKSRVEMKQLPDWLRRALGLPERFGNGHASRVPHEVEVCLNECLERMLSGPARDLQSAANIKIPTLVKTANRIFSMWKDVTKRVDEDIWEKFGPYTK